ncbi:unnamed protein product [Owenia fusiformis]|uniref:Aminotransferase class V domain-containing protein n=1 Tax=Owenia fusiformis TaxID=6347 RepID=A0A8J1UED1_OWEFU|nr:unnamed protein product [Owenia fusiformis]
MDFRTKDGIPFGGELKTSAYCLDPNVIFLNHGSYGAVPKDVQAEQTRLRDDLERYPDKWFRITNSQLWRNSLQTICSFLGAEVENTVFVENTTTGVDSVVKSIQFQPGDAILISNVTYNAMKNMGTFSTPKDVTVIYVELQHPIEDKEYILEKYREVLENHTNIRAAIIDHITSPTSIVLPVEELVKMLKEFGVLSIIDGAHAPGQIDLSIADIGADFYAGNLHKWLFTPRGCAILWIHPKHQTVIRPGITSHFHGHKLHYDFCVRGTRDNTPYHTVGAALGYLERLGGLGTVHNYTERLLDEGCAYLCKVLGTETYPLPPSLRAPSMRLLRIPHIEGYSRDPQGAGSLETELSTNYNIQTCMTFINGFTWIRLSVHVYNTIADFHKLGEALNNIMTSGKADRVRDEEYGCPLLHWDLTPLTSIGNEKTVEKLS